MSPLLNSLLKLAKGMIPISHLSQNEEAQVDFGHEFELLGPFKIGTREIVWGADPLERRGGFRFLSYDEEAQFDSPLGRNDTAKATLSINFEPHEADFPSTFYGWAALQYQVWARAWLVNHAPSEQRIELFTDGVWEYCLNEDKVFGGDLYGFRRAPSVLTLKPGNNRIDLRVYRDVRAFGGGLKDPMVIHLEARTIDAGPLVEDMVLVSDKINGKLPSPYASVIFRNADKHELQIESVVPVQGLRTIELLDSRKITVYPGQSRPVNLLLQIANSESSMIAFALLFKVKGGLEDGRSASKELTVKAQLNVRSMHEPHKFTFLNPSRTVSYAVLRPPMEMKLMDQETEPLPVMLSLHGAGVDVDSSQIRHSLDEVLDLRAWILFPQGGSLWSADDFHTRGFAEVIAAIDAIPLWIRTMGWIGPTVHTRRWMVSGHSNGGQGTWFVTSHYPDTILAAAPVSAYTSIENYVPYVFGRELEPLLSAVLHSTRMSFKHELLIKNMQDVPLLVQHGSNDDNVPVYHSRLMKSLINESSTQSTYVELPGEGHWFEGVMTTEYLQAFYRAVLNTKTLQNELPIDFDFVVADSDDFGSRGGLQIDQVESPARLARISVHRDVPLARWYLKTSNVHRFHINISAISVPKPRHLVMEGGQEFALNDVDYTMCVRNKDGSWSIAGDSKWKRIGQRYGRQRGALDAILRSTDRFMISYSSASELAIALQISRNFLQYFAADSEIVSRHERATATEQGNPVFVVCGLEHIQPYFITQSAIQIGDDSICLETGDSGPSHCYTFQPGLGAIFLRPLGNERLALIVWGYDVDGLWQAARLVPTLTGVGQPDFVITTAECRWRGAAGILAAGFFTYDWQISPDSFYR